MEPDPSTTAPPRWRAIFQPKDRVVKFAGPTGYYDAELLRGDLGGWIGTGLLALARPSGKVGRLRAKPWTVRTPKWSKINPGGGAHYFEERGGFRTQKRLRRILEIRGPEVAVFRFEKQMPESLVKALRLVFEGAERSVLPFDNDRSDSLQESDHGQENDGQVPDAPEGGEEPLAGTDPGRGLDEVHQ